MSWDEARELEEAQKRYLEWVKQPDVQLRANGHLMAQVLAWLDSRYKDTLRHMYAEEFPHEARKLGFINQEAEDASDETE